MKRTGIEMTLTDRVLTLANHGLERLRSWLHQQAVRAYDEARARWPGWRTELAACLSHLREALRPDAIRRRIDTARTWATLHDTVPPEATARLRERWNERRYRQEQREADHLQRQEEIAKKREKKDVEERQTYSVYFE